MGSELPKVTPGNGDRRFNYAVKLFDTSGENHDLPWKLASKSSNEVTFRVIKMACPTTDLEADREKNDRGSRMFCMT